MTALLVVSVWVAALVLLYLYSKAVRFVRLIRASKRLQKKGRSS